MASGDTNALIAIAIVLLILVIMYGGGCMGSAGPQPGAMIVQDKAVVTGNSGVAVAPLVAADSSAVAASTSTTVPNPVADAPPKTEYQFDPKKAPPAAQVERLTMAEARNVISRGIGNARGLYKDIVITPRKETDVLRTDQDIAKLFRPVERCCGERLTPNPAAEAVFQRAEKAVDPSYYTGVRRRTRKNYKKEGFVDANGRWQSFMYWKVGCAGDPRPKSLADRVESVDRLPRVAIPEDGVERLTQRQKLDRLRGLVNDQGLLVRGV